MIGCADLAADNFFTDIYDPAGVYVSRTFGSPLATDIWSNPDSIWAGIAIAAAQQIPNVRRGR